MGNSKEASILVLIGCLLLGCHEVVGQGDPLFLTPLINEGTFEEARALSRVGTLPFSEDLPARESYSGFITVNQQHDSNLFFWFFPAINNAESAPLLLWLEGGPGVSSFMTVFNQNGPYAFNAEGNLEGRLTDWAVNHSVIYLENPVGVGYSFARDPAGLSTTSEEAAVNAFEFLRQFFLLFPELSEAPFYAVGESFGGHFIPPLASLIHETNQGTDEKINLQGILLFCPWTNPFLQIKPTNYLYNLGLIDDLDLPYFETQETNMAELIGLGEFSAANDIFNNLIYLPGSTFANVTGFSAPYNVMQDQAKPESSFFIPYVDSPEFRFAMHAGNITYQDFSVEVELALASEIMTSKSSYVDELLGATEGYKVVIVSAQMDIIVPHKGVNALIDGFNWDGSEDMKNTPRSIWRVENTIAGYVRSFNQLSHIFMRNAGHFPITDQPDWNLVLVDCYLKQENCELNP